MLPPPLAPLFTPTPGCWAWLVSIAGWLTVAPPLAPPDTPAPADAGGVAMEPPPVMPLEAPPLVPCEPPTVAPPEALPPTLPDVWACAS